MVQNAFRPYQKEIKKLKESQSKGGTRLPKPRRVRKARSYPERDLVHLPLVNWFKLKYFEYARCVIHFAAERKCSPAQGAMLKAMGVQAGISDLFFAIPKKGYHGLWLELKALGKKPTPAQNDWLFVMSAFGYKTAWADTLGEAKNIVEDYLGGN